MINMVFYMLNNILAFIKMFKKNLVGMVISFINYFIQAEG